MDKRRKYVKRMRKGKGESKKEEVSEFNGQGERGKVPLSPFPLCPFTFSSFALFCFSTFPFLIHFTYFLLSPE